MTSNVVQFRDYAPKPRVGEYAADYSGLPEREYPPELVELYANSKPATTHPEPKEPA